MMKHAFVRTGVAGIVTSALLVVVPTLEASAASTSLSWGDTTQVSDAPQFSYRPRIAMSADGSRAIAIWLWGDGANLKLQSKSATIVNGVATWSTATVIADRLHQYGDDPQIVMSADGTSAAAAWLTSVGGNSVVYSRVATVTSSGVAWGSVAELSDATSIARRPRIAQSANGAMLTAVWLQQRDGRSVVQSRSAIVDASDASWGATTDLSDPGGDVRDLSIVLSAAGTKSVATWMWLEEDRYYAYLVQTRSAMIVDNVATWGPTTDLSDGAEGDGNYPQVALSANGARATAVWSGWDGQSNTMTAQSKSATILGNVVTWSTSTKLSDTTQNAHDTRVALSSDGTKATALWSRFNGSAMVLQSRSATIVGSAATWGAVSDLGETGGPQDAAQEDRPQAAMSADGARVTALWLLVGSDGEALLQTGSATIAGTVAAWTDVSTLSQPGENAGYPQLAMSADGTTSTVVWYGWTASRDYARIRARTGRVVDGVAPSRGGTLTSSGSSKTVWIVLIAVAGGLLLVSGGFAVARRRRSTGQAVQ